MHQALHNFVAQLADGSSIAVTKGDYLPDGHELVKRDQHPDQGSGTLFKKADFGEDEPPAKRGPGRPRKNA